MNIEIINPIEYHGWDELLLSSDQSIFFQTSAWAKVLCESYNYKPLYFVTKDNDRLSSLIPVMEVNSFLTGKRGISLPFTDYCRPIADSEDHLQGLTEKLIDYGQQAGWKHLELRGGMNYLEKSPASATFVSHSLDLSGGEQQIFKSFRDSTRRNIKKALKENIQVTFENSWKAIETFYNLNSITRKHHGIPPQPKKFFKKIFEYIISARKGFVVLARQQGKPIAGAVYFLFGSEAIYKYGASDKEFQPLRPNNLVMWEAIKWCASNGFKSFSLGRTEPENEGLLQFKRGWGAGEDVIKYYKYDFKKDSFLSKEKGIKSTYNFFKIMPLPLLRLTGNLLYRHIG